MADVMSPTARSALMSRIRSRDTGPELTLRRALWAEGCRFRTDWRDPCTRVRIDIAAPGKRIAVFVDGCFWHGCPLHAVTPATNTDFWTKKIGGNQARDERQTKALHEHGWTVVRLWEHEIESMEGVIARLLPMWRAPRPGPVHDNAEHDDQDNARQAP